MGRANRSMRLLQIALAGVCFASCIAINQYLTHYCVVRADIPFGAQAAQLIHAAGYSVSEPVPDGSYAIALHAKDEAELRALAEKLTAGGIEHKLIIESDPPYAGQAMAIGVRPMDRKRVKPFLSSFALVAQSGRAPGVMTREVSGSNPAKRAKPCGPVQRMRRWFGG